MSVLDFFKGKPKAPTPLQFHPDALAHYKREMILFLAGAKVIVKNPATGEWEATEHPTFDPALEYIANPIRMTAKTTYEDYGLIVEPVVKTVEVVKYVDRPVPAEPASIAGEPTRASRSEPVQLPLSTFKRGSVFTDSEGRQYMVIGDKVGLDPFYAGDVEGQLIVVRYDKGMKRTLQHRGVDGCHRSDATRDIGGTACARKKLVDVFQRDDGMLELYARKDGSTIVYDLETREAKIIKRS